MPLSLPARAVLAHCIAPLGAQLVAARAYVDGPVGALVLARDVDVPEAPPLHLTSAGHRCAILPLATLRQVCERRWPSIAPPLSEPTRPGEVWCLLTWRNGSNEEDAATFPLTPPPSMMHTTKGKA